MTPLDKRKLQSFRDRLGAMTSSEALQLAIEAQQYSVLCGPFDPAYRYFSLQQATLETYALLLENEEIDNRSRK